MTSGPFTPLKSLLIRSLLATWVRKCRIWDSWPFPPSWLPCIPWHQSSGFCRPVQFSLWCLVLLYLAIKKFFHLLGSRGKCTWCFFFYQSFHPIIVSLPELGSPSEYSLICFWYCLSETKIWLYHHYPNSVMASYCSYDRVPYLNPKPGWFAMLSVICPLPPSPASCRLTPPWL